MNWKLIRLYGIIGLCVIGLYSVSSSVSESEVSDTNSNHNFMIRTSTATPTPSRVRTCQISPYFIPSKQYLYSCAKSETSVTVFHNMSEQTTLCDCARLCEERLCCRMVTWTSEWRRCTLFHGECDTMKVKDKSYYSLDHNNGLVQTNYDILLRVSGIRAQGTDTYFAINSVTVHEFTRNLRVDYQIAVARPNIPMWPWVLAYGTQLIIKVTVAGVCSVEVSVLRASSSFLSTSLPEECKLPVLQETTNTTMQMVILPNEIIKQKLVSNVYHISTATTTASTQQEENPKFEVTVVVVKASLDSSLELAPQEFAVQPFEIKVVGCPAGVSTENAWIELSSPTSEVVILAGFKAHIHRNVAMFQRVIVGGLTTPTTTVTFKASTKHTPCR
eukprot:PhF_6_TR31529/c0_g1_i2/m.46481